MINYDKLHAERITDNIKSDLLKIVTENYLFEPINKNTFNRIKNDLDQCLKSSMHPLYQDDLDKLNYKIEVDESDPTSIRIVATDLFTLILLNGEYVPFEALINHNQWETDDYIYVLNKFTDDVGNDQIHSNIYVKKEI